MLIRCQGEENRWDDDHLLLRFLRLPPCLSGSGQWRASALHGTRRMAKVALSALLLAVVTWADDCVGSSCGKGKSPGVLLMQTKPGSLLKASEEAQPSKRQILEEVQGLQQQMSSMMSKMDSCCCSSNKELTLADTGLCAVFGDPHFITFDGAETTTTTTVGGMVQWLVKTNSIRLQALAKASEGFLAGFAASGSFMSDHRLVLMRETKEGPIKVTYDGVEILQEPGASFDVAGVMKAYRRNSWDSDLFDDRILSMRTRMNFTLGSFDDRFKNLPSEGIYLFRFPGLVDVTITGVDWLSAVISMPPSVGQTGYCGNFNEDAEDDAEPVVPSWDRPIGADLGDLPKSEWLFPHEPTVMLLGKDERSMTEEQEMAAKIRRINECPTKLLTKAEAACSGLTAAYHKFCVFDVCLTQDLAIARSVGSAAFVQHKVNARGVPIFMGHGRCLDQHGEAFHSFDTKLRTDTACQHLLRTLSLTDGVMGAQLKRGGTCEVLTVSGVDPTHVAIPGGWGLPTGPSKDEDKQLKVLPKTKALTKASQHGDPDVSDVSEANGKGLVADTTDEAAYNCWQLN
eukprot:Skav205421  [mRNA]  locus=scaffold582:231090:233681:- [translate_table: standard]